MKKEDLIKNVKDLEYNRVLNRENMLLVLIGTSVVSVIFAEKAPFPISKIWLVSMLATMAAVITIIFRRRLNKIVEEIQDL